MNKIAIIGAGAWGTTLAQVLTDNGKEVLIYDLDLDKINKINSQIHPSFNLFISKKIKATNSLDEIIKFSNNILIAIPSKVIRLFFKDLKNKLKDKKDKVNIINATKGIEIDTSKRVSEIAFEILGDSLDNFATLSGPSHAEDVILRKPTLLTCASNNLEFSKECQVVFSNYEYFRVYNSSDLIGVELCGSFKNAISVVSGIMQGLDFGDNARAALITRSLSELLKLVLAKGGSIQSVYGLTGLGDLLATASSYKSRNFRAGISLAKGIEISVIEKNEEQTIEGFRAISAFYNISKKENIQMPIICESYNVIYNKADIKSALKNLLERKLKEE